MNKAKSLSRIGLATLVLALSACVTDQSVGTGPLEIGYHTEANFRHYSSLQWPMSFAVSTDGNYSWGVYCIDGVACQSNDFASIAGCESRSKGIPCKLYARGRTIVWQGPVSVRPATSSPPPQTQALPAREKASARPIAVQWEGYDEFIVGTVTLYENASGGKMALSLPRNEGTCQGNYTYDKKGGGSWATSCTNGLAASGTFEGFGTNKGGAGKGTDTKGRAIKYTIGAESQ